MQVNLQWLMEKVSSLEEEKNILYRDLTTNFKNETIIELNGNEQVIKEFPDFEEKLEKHQAICKLVPFLKNIIAEKNNEYTLPSSGLTIQGAILSNKYLRDRKNILDYLATQIESKRRTSETTNSYFTSYTLAYDVNKVKDEIKQIDQELMLRSLEISKLNATMFTIADEALEQYKKYDLI